MGNYKVLNSKLKFYNNIRNLIFKNVTNLSFGFRAIIREKSHISALMSK